MCCHSTYLQYSNDTYKENRLELGTGVKSDNSFCLEFCCGDKKSVDKSVDLVMNTSVSKLLSPDSESRDFDISTAEELLSLEFESSPCSLECKECGIKATLK